MKNNRNENDYLISFIMPVYNAEKYLDKSIGSVVAQSRHNWELILIDDGSNDQSPAICNRWAENDSRILYYRQNNKGQGAARNKGIELARGEWISFIDDDDYIEADYIERVGKFATGEYDVILSCKADHKGVDVKDYLLDTDKDTISLADTSKDQLILSTLNYFYKAKYNYGVLTPGTPWGKLIRRDIVVKNGIFFTESYGEDRPFALQTYIFAKKILIYNKVMYHYLVHESTMRKYLPCAIEKYEPSRRKVHEIVEGYKHLDDAEEQLKQFDLAWFSYCCVQDFFHKNNAKSLLERRMDFFKARNQVEYCGSIDDVALKYLPMKRKILGLLIKKRMFLLIDLLNRIRVNREYAKRR